MSGRGCHMWVSTWVGVYVRVESTPWDIWRVWVCVYEQACVYVWMCLKVGRHVYMDVSVFVCMLLLVCILAHCMDEHIGICMSICECKDIHICVFVFPLAVCICGNLCVWVWGVCACTRACTPVDL